jgi:hypothetical protein
MPPSRSCVTFWDGCHCRSSTSGAANESNAISRELPRMLAAAVFDRGRQVRQPIEIIKPAGIRQIVRLKNSPALVFGKGGARNAKMLGGYACGEDPLRFDGGCFWHRNHCNRVNFTISISPAAARTREFLNFGLRLRPFGNAQQDPRRVLKCIYSAR